MKDWIAIVTTPSVTSVYSSSHQDRLYADLAQHALREWFRSRSFTIPPDKHLSLRELVHCFYEQGASEGGNLMIHQIDAGADVAPLIREAIRRQRE